MPDLAERIAHLDMDAFFVEVERRRCPDLIGRAVMVGGAGNRGVVASASYEVRRRGVRSGMPMVHARRLVPGGVVVAPDHTAYREFPVRVFEILETFAPSIEQVSVDEAFLHPKPVEAFPASGNRRVVDTAPRTCGVPVMPELPRNRATARFPASGNRRVVDTAPRTCGVPVMPELPRNRATARFPASER